MGDADALFVALDAGTTGARATAVALDGAVADGTRRSYPTRTPRPGWAEQDPADWRAAALESLRELIGRVGAERVRAIGLTGQCPTIAPLGSDGAAVGPGMLYRDNRAVAEAAWMRETLGEERLHARTGHVPEAFHVGPKVLWLREHAPDVFARTACLAQPRDVVLHALSGVLATDETHADTTVLFDLRERRWDDELLRAVALDADRFPAVFPPWTVVAQVDASAAAATGAPAGLPIVLGAADSQCAAYGSGVVRPGPISEMAGASSCLNSVVDEPLSDLRVTHYSHVVPDCYSTELGLNTSGAAVAWAIAELGFPDYAAFEAAATRVRQRATATDPLDLAPVFLPHLGDGERDDPRLRAAFVGLSDRHGRDELAFAVAEGVAFGIAETLDVLVAAGSPLDELRVAGGGARIGLLGQLKADALGVPVRHMTVDTAPVGVALLAASALGHAGEVAGAVDRLLDAAQCFAPDAACGEVLAERRSWYRAVQAATAVRLPDREEPSP